MNKEKIKEIISTLKAYCLGWSINGIPKIDAKTETQIRDEIACLESLLTIDAHAIAEKIIEKIDDCYEYNWTSRSKEERMTALRNITNKILTEALEVK